MKFKQAKNKQKGFTLIEVLISAAIFAMVITVSMVVFGANSNLQSRSDAIRTASESAKFIIEAIARDVRLSDSFILSSTSCDNSTPKKCKSISITQGDNTINYIYDAAAKKIMYSDSKNTTQESLNTANVRVDSLVFSGVDTSDISENQPQLKVSIDFTAVIGTKAVETQSEHVETSISTRNYPDYYKKFTQ